MRAAPIESPTTAATVAGLEANPYEKLRRNFTTADDALAILRQAQAVVAGMIVTIDRMQERIARVVSP